MSTGRAFDPYDVSGRINWVHLKRRGEVHVHLHSFPSCTILMRKPIDVRFHLDPDGKVMGHLECELMPAVVFLWEKLIDMGVDKEV